MKIIFKKEKGWLKALGLHHAAITLIVLSIGHFIGIGDFLAAFAIGWYGCKEMSGQVFPLPQYFEIMDFISPALVSIIYLVFIRNLI
jgi:ABC-type antimicrobial peptide transport system permease subunit